MAIKVEGVEPAHPPEPDHNDHKVTTDTSDLWAPLYRVKALQLALLGSYANFQPEQVIDRAAAFEAYITQGAPPAMPHAPTVEEQISAVFSNLTGSLDGNPV